MGLAPAAALSWRAASRAGGARPERASKISSRPGSGSAVRMDDDKQAPFDTDGDDDTPAGDTDEHSDVDESGQDPEGRPVGGG